MRPCSSACENCRPASSQVGSVAAAARAPAVRRARSAGSPISRIKAKVSSPTLSGGTSTPAPDGTASGIAPAVVPDHRQPVRDRLGIGHAVAFVARRQHEQVGRRIEARQPLGRHDAGKLHAVGREAAMAICSVSAAAVAGLRPGSPAITSRHGRSGNLAQRRDQHVIALAGHDRADRQEIDDVAAGALRQRNAIVARQHDAQLLLRHAQNPSPASAPSSRWW